MRNFNHSLSGRDGDIIIFAELFGMIESRERAPPPIAKEVFPIDGA